MSIWHKAILYHTSGIFPGMGLNINRHTYCFSQISWHGQGAWHCSVLEQIWFEQPDKVEDFVATEKMPELLSLRCNHKDYHILGLDVAGITVLLLFHRYTHWITCSEFAVSVSTSIDIHPRPYPHPHSHLDLYLVFWRAWSSGSTCSKSILVLWLHSLGLFSGFSAIHSSIRTCHISSCFTWGYPVSFGYTSVVHS